MSLTLRAAQLSFAWPGGIEAVRNVSLVCKAGGIQILAGPSGSGKSTLAQLLTGLQSPTHGSVRLTDGARDISLRQTAYVFQFPEALFFCDSVREEFLDIGGAGAWVSGSQWLSGVGLHPESISAMHPFHLSLGIGRLVALGLQISRGPRVLVVDEPTISLDWRFRAQVSRSLREWISPERILIVLTHDLVLMRELGGELSILRAGAIHWTGDTQTALSDSDLLESFDLM